MNNEITCFELEDGVYYVLDKIDYEGKKYLYLFNEANPADYLIQEYRKEDPNTLYEVAEDKFDQIVKEFIKKRKEALKWLLFFNTLHIMM